MGKRHVSESTKRRAQNLFRIFKADRRVTDVRSNYAWKGFDEARLRIAVSASRYVSCGNYMVTVRASIFTPSEEGTDFDVRLEIVSKHSEKVKGYRPVKNDMFVEIMGFAYEEERFQDLHLPSSMTNEDVVKIVSESLESLNSYLMKESLKRKILAANASSTWFEKDIESIKSEIIKNGFHNGPTWVKNVTMGCYGRIMVTTSCIGVKIAKPGMRGMNLLVFPKHMSFLIDIRQKNQGTSQCTSVSVSIRADVVKYEFMDSGYRKGCNVHRVYKENTRERDVIVGISDQLKEAFHALKKSMASRKEPMVILESV